MLVPNNEVAASVEEAVNAANLLGGDRLVVKAQVHAGGRGKAGGVKIVDGKDELSEAVRDIEHAPSGHQTDASGQPVNQVIVEEPSAIARELYLGAVIDRATAHRFHGIDRRWDGY